MTRNRISALVELDQLKNEKLGYEVRIENLCKAIEDFETTLKSSGVDFDPEGSIQIRLEEMLHMKDIKGLTI